MPAPASHFTAAAREDEAVVRAGFGQLEARTLALVTSSGRLTEQVHRLSANLLGLATVPAAGDPVRLAALEALGSDCGLLLSAGAGLQTLSVGLAAHATALAGAVDGKYAGALRSMSAIGTESFQALSAQDENLRELRALAEMLCAHELNAASTLSEGGNFSEEDSGILRWALHGAFARAGERS